MTRSNLTRDDFLDDGADTPTPRERAISMLKHGASFDHAARVLDISKGELDLLLWNGLGGDVQSEAVAA